MLQRFSQIIFVLTVFTALASCEKAPNYVIGESDMEDLLVDIYKAEAYIDSHSADFQNDSSKMMLKQSVFMKHGVTAAEFDTSMVWYSKNIDVFLDVHDKVRQRYEEEERQLNLAMGKVTAVGHRRTRGISYKNFGDTADLWESARQLIVSRNISNSVLPFEIKSNQESQKGDKYCLRMKLTNNKSSVQAFVGIIYNDETYTCIERRSRVDGWLNVEVQGDSLKNIRKVFGYLKANEVADNVILYVDSIMVLRTHLDRNTYNIISSQKQLDRKRPINEIKVTANLEVAEELEAVDERQAPSGRSQRLQRPSAQRAKMEAKELNATPESK